MKYQKAKGTTDFYPEEKRFQVWLFDILRKVAIKYNYSEIEAPAFEEISLLTAKSGDEIKTQIFNLEKKGKEEFGLRFDMTISAARMFMEKQKELAKPIKWFYATRMWRYEQPQKGRLREFYQFGTECFGSALPESDAEVIKLIVDLLLSLGLKKEDFIVKINNRNLLEGLLKTFVSEDNLPELMRLIDKKSKIKEEDFDVQAKELGVKDTYKLKTILNSDKIEDLEKLELNDLAKDGLGDLKDVYNLLDKDLVKIDFSIARGLAYYTGTVFEVYDIEQKYRAIAGGGRYDKLIELLGGQPTPAVGFAMGYSTLSLLLDNKGLLPDVEKGPEYFIAIINDGARKAAMDLIYKLRKTTSVDFDLAGRNLSNQIKHASNINAQKLIVMGSDEVQSGKVKVKDLSSGNEVEKELKDF